MPYAANGAIQLYYEIEGAGTPLVLHCGATQAQAAWRRAGVVAALRDDHRLILIDPRGLGRSDKPRAAAAYTLAARVRDVTAVLDAEAIARAHFWGYSAGGVVGLALGVHAPGRCRSLVLGGVDPWYANDRAAGLRLAEEWRRGTMAGHLARQEARSGPLPPDERAEYLANDPQALAAMREAAAREPSLAAAYPALAPPLLSYAGDRDPACAGARRTPEIIPGATFLPLPGLDHARAFREPSGILSAVRAFLAGTESGEDTCRGR